MTSSATETAPAVRARRLAVLVDGDNMSADRLTWVESILASLGTVHLAKAWVNRLNPQGFELLSHVHVTYLDSWLGKNSGDISLVIGALEIASRRIVDGFAIVSSDRDFAPLARNLRERGFIVLGFGRKESSPPYRESCDAFFVDPSRKVDSVPAVKPDHMATTTKPKQPKTATDQTLAKILKEKGSGGWFPINEINDEFRRRNPNFKIKSTTDKTWRAYLKNRPDIYDCEPKGPKSRFRAQKSA